MVELHRRTLDVAVKNGGGILSKHKGLLGKVTPALTCFKGNVVLNCVKNQSPPSSVCRCWSIWAVKTYPKDGLNGNSMFRRNCWVYGLLPSNVFSALSFLQVRPEWRRFVISMLQKWLRCPAGTVKLPFCCCNIVNLLIKGHIVWLNHVDFFILFTASTSACENNVFSNLPGKYLIGEQEMFRDFLIKKNWTALSMFSVFVNTELLM